MFGGGLWVGDGGDGLEDLDEVEVGEVGWKNGCGVGGLLKEVYDASAWCRFGCITQQGEGERTEEGKGEGPEGEG